MTKKEYRHPWAELVSSGFDMGLMTGGDGAEEEMHRATRFGLEVVSVLQRLSDQNRVAESNQRTHEDLRGLARIDRLKLARLDTVT